MQTPPVTMAMAGSKSEDILGEKWDRCVADTLIKIGEAEDLVSLFTREVHLVVSRGLGKDMGEYCGMVLFILV